MTQRMIFPIWTPEDTVALRQLADEFPREIGESALLAEWVDRFAPSTEQARKHAAGQAATS